MPARLVVKGITEISDFFGEISRGRVSLATPLWLQNIVALSAGDTVKSQGYFRAADGYFATDHMWLQ